MQRPEKLVANNISNGKIMRIQHEIGPTANV